MQPATNPPTEPSKPGVFTRIMNGLTRARMLLANMLFVLLLLVLALFWIGSLQSVAVPKNAALVLNPEGVIVESQTLVDPLQSLLSAPGAQEVELQSLLQAIRHATLDSDIKMILLDLDELQWAAPAHTQRLGQALQNFKASGKKVVAYGHYFNQAAYHLASFSNALYMHPMGQVVLEGFGGLSFYIKDLLDKLGVNIHVFRVGTYKSAVEPFIRNDMSAESRLANQTLYRNLWQHVVSDIAVNRQLEMKDVQVYADNLAGAAAASQGDMARAALENYLVDELLTTDQAKVRVADEVGMDSQGEINGIDYRGYLQARNIDNYGGESSDSNNKVAVVFAQGMIVANEQRGQGGVVAAEPVIELIRRARHSPEVKALVLRIDSPGGSQFASELIRQELELVQLAGKPVVASFGATAASGGYWIAATADAIISEATTLTGSIGIFSIATTFEHTLGKVGVHTDGVGTTENTLGMNPYSGINDTMAKVFQAQVEHGYEQFTHLVARGRNLSLEEIGAVAEGRVWSGKVAQELGLVDELGGLQTALRKAADLADLEEWSSVKFALPVDARSLIIAQLLGQEARGAGGLANNSVGRLGQQFRSALQTMERLDDPLNLYALCATCLGRWR